MKLACFSRTPQKKGENNRLRRENAIPAILYGKGEIQPIFVKQDEFSAMIRSMNPDLLATTPVELQDGQKTHKVLVKEVQYHRSSYAVEHIDFFLIPEKALIQVNVPIQITGAADSTGVKLGGFVRQVIRSITVECLLRDLPKEFTLDVRELVIGQCKRLSDIPMPAGVKPIAKLEEVAVVIAKKV